MKLDGPPFQFSDAAGLTAREGGVLPNEGCAAQSGLPQRLKLWQLAESMHCSVIGTCLTTGELRQAMARVFQADVSHISDHDLHARAVGLCSSQTPASKLLNKVLDQRHGAVIRQFSRLQTEAAVMEKWDEARRAGDIPGAYWAVLTHPHVGFEGSRHAFGDVHMLSHLVGAANRADIRRLTALEEENAALRSKVERQQARLQKLVAAQDALIGHPVELTAVQVQTLGGPDDGETLSSLRHLVSALRERLSQELGRRQQLEQRAADAAEASKQWERRARSAEARCAALDHEIALLERHEYSRSSVITTLDLPAERILYVGGRPGCIEQIRELMLAAGGELLRHDGGRHDQPSLLPGLICQADRVTFPVDCVSHDAALTVKRMCRQLGKVWLPLRSSGLASFLAAMTNAANDQRPRMEQ